MIIKSLELINFRQFKGKNTLDFSVDINKKATLVIAENTTGKTTLLESFSWIFYGETSLKSIINTQIKKDLPSNGNTTVEGKVVLVHMNKEYIIGRRQKLFKAKINYSFEDSIFTIKTIENGICKQVRGREANKIINEIVPKDLFSYFFFKGENIEKIGREINKGKSGNSREFVTAIRGMLGFNWLYETNKHLQRVIKDYRYEIERNNNDAKLQTIIKQINEAEDVISQCKDRLEIIDNELTYYKSEREKISEEILLSGDVSEKQSKSRKLEIECTTKRNYILKQKKEIFSRFSSLGYEYIVIPLIEKAIDTLTSKGEIEKGIPGLNAKAVQYMIKKKKCICGTTIEDNSDEMKILEDLIKYLPPHNIGYEIKSFSQLANNIKLHGGNYYEDFISARRKLQEDIELYNIWVNELQTINEDIKKFPDISQKKEREQKLKDMISELEQEKGRKNSDLKEGENDLASAKKERDSYKTTDTHNKKIQLYERYATSLSKRIENYCNKQEKIKRDELQNAINEIFKDIFDTDITITLSDNYDIQLKTKNNEDLSDFENSTSQDGIMAFSFIGGIIKLAKNKLSNTNKSIDEDEISDELETEPYPLVMDAPSSSFDITRIKNFCKIMPSIAEQVIVFIKDTDGLYVKEHLSSSIGSEYKLIKDDKFTTRIVPGDC